ncbi:MAG: hypothetical protein ABI895_30205 [Deltaproteobacteria bacterium]
MSRRSNWSWWVGITLGSWLVGCDGPRDCNTGACSGPAVTLALVDESGQGVAAKGEYRSNDGRSLPQPFDCTLARTSLFAACAENVVRLYTFNLQPGMSHEVHFEGDNGEWSEWLPVPLQLTRRTDPDFNGPGCSCTWYTGQAEPLVVPAAVRRTAAVAVGPGSEAPPAALGSSAASDFATVVPSGGKVTTTLGPFVNAHSSRPITRVFQSPDGLAPARIYLSHQIIDSSHAILSFELDVVDAAAPFALAEHGFLTLGKFSDQTSEDYATAATVTLSSEAEGALRISLQGIEMAHLESDGITVTPRPSLGDGLVVGEVLSLCIVNESAASRAWALEHCPGGAEPRFLPQAQAATPAP